MSISYAVQIEPFADRHFIKSFEKKHRGAWQATWKGLVEEWKRFDALLESSIAETITNSEGIRICKTEFRVAGTHVSRKASGNRCILAVHSATATVHVLLVYSKTDITGGNETAKWKSLVRENYPEYAPFI